MKVQTKRQRRPFDWTLLFLVLALATLGLLNLRSASEVEGVARHATQLVWMLIGGTAAGVIAAIDYRQIQRWAYVIFAGAVCLLCVVLFVYARGADGGALNNSRRWIDLGAFYLQPSELMKVTVIVVTARYFSDNADPDGHTLKSLLVPLTLALIPVVLIIMQPDLGTALVIFFMFATIALFDGIRTGTLIGLGGAGIVTMPMLWMFVMKDYQKSRVIAFLNPGENLQGDAWQVNQALIAIGSGRLWGKGFLHGTQVQNGFVPEHENDFIFAHHGEQFGFAGSALLLVLYFALMLWALRIARHGRDHFAVLCAVGVAAFFFWHVTVNLGMVTGLLPVVGLWLPLASYGGSSTLTVMFAIGLLMSISIRRANF
ncbi:MAG: rod shape determining protein RodA [Bradymonadia bacterium]|jgi:rod shape determining protein RodA